MKKQILDFLFGKDRKAAADSIFWNTLKIIGIVAFFVIVIGIQWVFHLLIGAL